MELTKEEKLIRIARQTAAIIRDRLEECLIQFYGTDWLITVNKRLKDSGKFEVRSISDHRSCISLFGYDLATESWAPEGLRRMALQLAGLTTKAHHDRPGRRVTDSDLNMAKLILQAFLDSPYFSVSQMADRTGSECVELIPGRGSDTYQLVTLAIEEALSGVVKEISLSSDPQRGATLKVRFPPKVTNAQVLKIQGYGNPGINGGEPGDLRIMVHIDFS